MAHLHSVADNDPGVIPFGVTRRRLDDSEPLIPIKSLEPRDTVAEPDAPSRTIFRRVRDGKLIFVEVNEREAVQIGIGTTFTEAQELALSVLGSAHAARDLTLTGALQILAVALLAAQAQAERFPVAARGA